MISKELYLIRHGKAEEHSFEKNDYNRNLIEKGKNRSKIIASKLLTHIDKSKKILVISSTANRAFQTAEIFCKILDYPTDQIQLEKDIYEAYYLDVQNIINKISDDIDIVLVFGHNPGLSNLTNHICNSYIDLKTSHVSKIRLEDDFNFKEVSGNTGYLETLIHE